MSSTDAPADGVRHVGVSMLFGCIFTVPDVKARAREWSLSDDAAAPDANVAELGLAGDWRAQAQRYLGLLTEKLGADTTAWTLIDLCALLGSPRMRPLSSRVRVEVVAWVCTELKTRAPAVLQQMGREVDARQRRAGSLLGTGSSLAPSAGQRSGGLSLLNARLHGAQS